MEMITPKGTAILLRYNPYSGHGIILTAFHVPHSSLQPLFATFTYDGDEEEDEEDAKLSASNLTHYAVPLNDTLPGDQLSEEEELVRNMFSESVMKSRSG